MMVAGSLRDEILLIIVPAVVAVIGIVLGWPLWIVLLAGGAAIKLLLDFLLQVQRIRREVREARALLRQQEAPEGESRQARGQT